MDQKTETQGQSSLQLAGISWKTQNFPEKICFLVINSDFQIIANFPLFLQKQENRLHIPH